MGYFVPLNGKRFGRLVVLKDDERKQGDRHSYCLCLCDCGNTKLINKQSLRSGKTNSCGCLAKEIYKICFSKVNTTHGLSHHPLYSVYNNMVQRCYNIKNTSYHNYGGREIKVCDRWLGKKGIQNFIEDMSTGYQPNMTLERINNDKDYCVDNCCWKDRESQNKNTRRTHFITYEGKTQCLKDWADELGFKYSTLSGRIRRGWCIKRAFETHVKNNNEWECQGEY